LYYFINEYRYLREIRGGFGKEAAILFRMLIILGPASKLLKLE
jgi:hypothetical protein